VLSEWAVAFFFTQLFELPIYWRASRSLKVGFLASAITHPVVWFGFPRLMSLGLGYWPMVVLAECFAVGVEAGWLSFNGVKRPFAWSLGANLCSVTLGFLMRETLGFP
jgi:hypothetical protein